MANVFVVVMMLSAMNLNYSNKMEAKKTVNQIKQLKTDSTIVYIVPSWVAYLYAYHYDRAIFLDYKNFEERLQVENIYVLSSVEDLDSVQYKDAGDIILFEGWNNMSQVDPEFKIINKLEYEFGEIDNTIRNWGYTVYHISKQN
jgi:hypothetical protein